MSDPSNPTAQPGGPAEPTEEEMRAYLAELRSAELSDIVAQVQSMLLNAVQVKLGRNDARVLLDVVAGVNQQVRAHVDDDLTGQVDNALAQLRVAQVEAEQQAKQLRDEGKLPDVEPGDIGPEAGAGAASPGAAPATGSAPAAAPSAGSPGSRLWTPGA